MDPQALVTIILFGPLIGAAVAGLVGKRIGDKASMSVTTGFLMLSAVLSWVVFSQWTWGGLEPFTAACAGVRLHARAGIHAAHEKGVDGVIARDVIEALPFAR